MANRCLADRRSRTAATESCADYFSRCDASSCSRTKGGGIDGHVRDPVGAGGEAGWLSRPRRAAVTGECPAGGGSAGKSPGFVGGLSPSPHHPRESAIR